MTEYEFYDFLKTKSVVDGFCNSPIDQSNYYLFDIHEGWRPLIINLINELLINGWNGKLLKCHSEYGVLKFLILDSNPKLWEIIDKYQELSLTTCELCGSSGRVHTNSLDLGLCSKHVEELNGRKETSEY